MILKVKVCGITNIEDALLVESCGASGVGFIFYQESKRFVTPEKVKEIDEKLSDHILRIGVFVNTNADIINEISDFCNLNIVQLHGDEPDSCLKEINLPIIRAYRVESNSFKSVVINTSFVSLFDSFSDGQFGGTGKQFRWDIIPEVIINKSILSGGLNIDNLEQLFRDIRPAAIDISSSVEKTPGKKDKKKVKEFFNKYQILRNNYADFDGIKFDK